MNQAQQGKKPLLTLLAVLASLFLIAAACGDDGDSEAGGEGGESGESDGDRSINVAIVGGNPQMEDIQALTPELFTEDSGIEVNYTALDEGQIRQLVSRELTGDDGNFDVVMVGLYDTPLFAAAGNLAPLTEFAEADEEYNVEGIFQSVRDGLSVDGDLFAAPFYAESSFLAYRADLFEEAGVEPLSDNPTWEEVAAAARAIDSEDVSGICLRGLAGWGDLGASFTTVLNTFGGTWWEANEDGTPGAAQVDQPEFREALEFYVDLLADAGQDDAANSSFNQCRELYEAGGTAMWYDATVGASFLDAADSAVVGNNVYVQAPVAETDASGWLWSWNLAIPEFVEDKETAWEFVSWATSEQYLEDAAVALDGGWAAVPPGTRTALYENEEYLAAAEAFAQPTLDAIAAADPTNPGTTPRPGLGGVQFVGIPEWQAFGTACTEQLSSVIAGAVDIDSAIAECQRLAEEISQ